jgi:hypothetical protein
MRNPLEDRAISSRSQADAWVREMSMQISHGTTKTYWLRDSGVEPHDSNCKRIENQHLQRQKRDVVGLHEARTHAAICPNVYRINQLQKVRTER